MTRDLPHIGPAHFPHIPRESWRDDAACAKSDDLTLWDAPVGKPKKDDKNAVRAAKAKRICNTLCPVRVECAAAFDWRFDEGIRGGHDTPPIHATSSSAGVRVLRLKELLMAGFPLDDAVRIMRPKRDRKAS